MNELISPDHRSSGNGWADQLTAYRQRTRGRSRGLERDASEICVFERPVAVDTSSGAALSPSFSLRDTSNLWTDTSHRWTAAASSGALLRVGTGTATSNVYLKDPGGLLPPWAIAEDARRSTKSMNPSSNTTNAMMTVNGQHGAMVGVVENEPATGCHVVRVPTSEADSDSLVVMICILFRRCTDESSRAFASILSSRLRLLEIHR